MTRRRPIARATRFAVESLDARLQFSGAAPAPVALHAAPLAADYKELGINLGGLNYYANFWPFADVLKMESRGWMPAGTYNSAPVAGLDATGDPVNAGSYHAEPFQNSPAASKVPAGVYVVTWDGSGDVTMGLGATLVSGTADDHRRVYRLAAGARPIVNLTNNATGDGHVTNVHCWMPDPGAPNDLSLEPAAGTTRLWHPQYLDHLRELAASTGYLRFMDWTVTNSSPQVNWSDRRPANHEFANGDLNYKLEPIPGETTRNGNVGAPWEYVIDLCNTLGVNAWINVPHAASDDYVHNLAKLFTGQLETSVGLTPGLRVYLEYSNEVWSGGSAFRQGDWAQGQGALQGLSKAQFAAKRSVEIFRIFDQEFAAAPSGARAGDVVRVAAAFTGQTTAYTTPYLAAIDQYAHAYADETPYTADVLAVTTYFGGQQLIQYAFNQTNWLTANLNDPNDPAFTKIFDYWTTELALNARSIGIEGDAGAGGFGTAMSDLAAQYGLKLVSYEGGPSLYTAGVTTYVKDGKIVDAGTSGSTATASLSAYVQSNYADDDADPTNNDRFTKLIAALNRHPRIAEVYQAVLETAKAQGLKTHALFTDISGYNKNGQWGHKEYLGQAVGTNYGDAVKWNFTQQYGLAEALVRDVDDVLGLAPSLPGNQLLGQVFAGDAFTKTLAAAPGDGVGDLIRYELVAGKLPPGIGLVKVDDGTFQVTGTPTTAGTYRFMVRALDADNDPAYAAYGLTVLPSAGASTAFAANNDTFADQNGTATTNNGAGKYLYAGTGTRTSYVKFNVGAQSAGKIDRVVLRLFVRDYENGIVPTTGGQLWVEAVGDLLRNSSTVWTENNLTSATSPASGATIGGVKTLGKNPGGYYEFDVTAYVKSLVASGISTVDLAVRGRVIGGPNPYVAIRLASKEYAGGAYAPTVIVTTSPAAAPTPPQVLIEPILTNPRTGSVDPITVTFDRPVAGVDLGDFTLTRDGTAVGLGGAVLATADGISYTISNTAQITTTAGTYLLTLVRDGSEIRDAGGTLLGAGDTEDWLAYSDVAGRYTFYNNSFFDSGAGKGDDTAIAPDKAALRPGATATFANYTSSTLGLNGVIVDLSGLPSRTLTAADFLFKVGNSSTLTTWTTLATSPTIAVRKGAGVNGSDRVTLTWPDNTIVNKWLQVTVKATTATGLLLADVFYFGNVLAESGDSTTNTIIDNTDIFGAYDNQRDVFNRASITDLWDYDRDGLVNNNDFFAAYDNQTSIFTSVKLISV